MKAECSNIITFEHYEKLCQLFHMLISQSPKNEKLHFFKVVDSCRIFFEDTFRSVLIYRKELEPRQKFHNRPEKVIFLKRFDPRNMFF